MHAIACRAWAIDDKPSAVLASLGCRVVSLLTPYFVTAADLDAGNADLLDVELDVEDAVPVGSATTSVLGPGLFVPLSLVRAAFSSR